VPVRMGDAGQLDAPVARAPLDVARIEGVRPAADARGETLGLEAHRFTSPVVPPAVTSVDPGDDGTRVPPWLTAGIDILRALGLPAAVIEPVQGAVERLAGWARIRPRFLLAGAAGAAALVVALAIVAAPPGPAAGSATEPAPSSTEGPEPEGERSPAVGAVGDRSDSASDAPESVLHPEPEEWQGVVAALVDRWSVCRAPEATVEVESGCGALVTHAGSAAERLLHSDDDRHAVLGRWIALRGEAVVIERMGGAVLVDLVVAGTTTASLLVVRSEAGWRIRDVIG